ncbi:hypothetical protein K431DRAFT_281720 [Polychaeton citri CBS 116435]|uniref:Uncharacterized protein n=1 Tax=Polychaeton citri CBS 116435 TaxID=1314669 RepID=A0A9P4UQP8_9PEZI|nr:hypothetical protein K431DRAFT_281720 [Polychaeton citri CBS 116435]
MHCSQVRRRRAKGNLTISKGPEERTTPRLSAQAKEGLWTRNLPDGQRHWEVWGVRSVDATDRQDMQERASYEDRRPSRSPSRREKHRERRGHHHQNDNIKRSHSHRARSRSASPKRTRHHSRYVSITSNSDEGADSDPLVDVIGPAKPSNSKPRGRGASKSAFDSIDARFAPDYDPIADVRLNDDDDTASVDKDDWDMALEALRDRQRYKSTQEARLKAAGFSEREIDRWRNSDGSEIHEEDVKWSKRGEAREWDRGKANLL